MSSNWIIKLSVLVLFLAVLFHYLLEPLDVLFSNPSTAIAGKKVIVTGSSYGLGRDMAIEFAKHGALSVALVARSQDKLIAVKESIHQQYPNVIIHIISADLSSEEKSTAAVKEASELMGGIDFLILNHITSSGWKLWFQDSLGSHENNVDGSYSSNTEKMLNIFNVNFYSYVWMASAAMSDLIKSNGQIAVISSLAGYLGAPRAAAYSASKHALHGFFNTMRSELRILGVNNVDISICAVGATDTEGAKDVMKALENKVTFDSSEYAAKTLVKAIAAKKQLIFHPSYKVYTMVVMNFFFPSFASYLLEQVVA